MPELLYLTQPIEELERQAQEKSLRFKPPGLAAAQSVWDRELGPFQSIVNMSYILSGTSISGLLGQIRTKLIDGFYGSARQRCPPTSRRRESGRPSHRCRHDRG